MSLLGGHFDAILILGSIYYYTALAHICDRAAIRRPKKVILGDFYSSRTAYCNITEAVEE